MILGTFFTGLGFLVGTLVFALAARRRAMATEGMGWLALYGFCGGIFGAKLTEWAMHWSVVAAHPAAILDPRLGGRTIVGGILAGWLTVEIAKWRLGIRRSTGDLFAFALPAGEAVGRIGCFFNGCCFGVPGTVPWAVYQHGAWRHPAQLYSAFAAACIFMVLLALRDSLRREGDAWRVYLVLWGASRFVLEFWRERPLAWGGLSLAQWTCLEVVIMAALMLFVTHRRANLAARVA